MPYVYLVDESDIWCVQYQFLDQLDGLVQERRNSIANALELCLSCINPSNCSCSVIMLCIIVFYLPVISYIESIVQERLALDDRLEPYSWQFVPFSAQINDVSWVGLAA